MSTIEQNRTCVPELNKQQCMYVCIHTETVTFKRVLQDPMTSASVVAFMIVSKIKKVCINTNV